jgi:acyl carrier protein
VKEIFGANINFNQPFLEAGLDSLSAVELCDAVAAAIGIELPSTVVFDYPSVAAISDFIVSQMHPEAEALDDNGITGHKPIVTYGAPATSHRHLR